MLQTDFNTSDATPPREPKKNTMSRTLTTTSALAMLALCLAVQLSHTVAADAQPGEYNKSERGPGSGTGGPGGPGKRDQAEPFGDGASPLEEPSEHDRERFEELFKNPAKLFDVVRDIDPALADELEQLKDTRPRAVFSVLRRQFPQVMRLALLKDEDPALYQLRVRDLQLTRQADQLADQHRDARKRGDKDAADAIEDQLEPIVVEHFDIRQKVRERELEKLEERIEQLKDALDERDSNKRNLIKQRLAELLGASDARGW